ncbi:pentapeptide repeat-containing protein [Cronbergia sp. UHCC 0137]|uniref:pentapeptide repeat-containing protein n=1 Tax=Cronbergia sp. UHCC 0137 TaxID=3110239 RepID=UPI002B1F7BA3|nr:pentapeptide repeat-containing protein [Cronbergia sp. UHCC 0137]MEA5618902.1 pentapeptide repeat-containing protein [Cronbergia sp. UHCC 0137]
MGWKKRRWKITGDELLERYASGERNFAGVELVEYGSRPSKYSGPGSDLDGVVLRDINLQGAVFQQVYLIGADLTGADLGGIFMLSSCLSEGIIRDANLCGANVCRSGFINTDLRGTDLNNINATGTCFRGAYLPTFESAILADANFQGAHTRSELICNGWNLIWRTTMPDGIVVRGPQWGNISDVR